ncbi:hypothetical protein AB0C96_40405 [Streptomyces sp. NPDC048506]|uniref:hypothetical protein n=1 Tax=Streptomyces sp. NPDC048506 TaxID=3155028 RepID=UPI00342AFD36
MRFQERGESGARPGPGSPGAQGEPAAPDGPRPLGVGVTPTGQPAVDAGLRRLADADHLPSSGHLQVYEDVHRGLRDVLAGLDQHPGPPAPPPASPRADSATPTSPAAYDNRS